MKLQNPSGVFELNRQERRGSFFGTLLSQLPRVQRLEDEAPLESPQGFFFPRDFCAHPSFPECASCSEMLRDGALGAGEGIRWKAKEPVSWSSVGQGERSLGHRL